MSGERKLEDWIDSYLSFVEKSEPPILFHTWTAISCIAACLERKCRLEWGLETLYPNMYIVLCAASGRCRKGTALGVGLQFLNKIGVKLAAESITREALIRELKTISEIDIDPQTKECKPHSSLTVYSPELVVFLGSNALLLGDLCDWFDCRDRWIYRTKGCGTDEIVGTYVNLIGGTTPTLIQAALPDTTIGSGLASRIIFVYEDNKAKTEPRPFLSPEKRKLGELLLHDLQAIHTMRGEYRMTDEAMNLYERWYIQQEDHPPIEDPHFDGYISRRATHLRKLMMIVAASRSSKMIIFPRDFDRARRLLERTERKMVYTFRGMGRSDTAGLLQQLMSVIASMGRITKQELLWRFRSEVRNKDEFDRIIATLVEMKYCRLAITATDTFIEYIPENLERN